MLYQKEKLQKQTCLAARVYDVYIQNTCYPTGGGGGEPDAKSTSILGN